MHKVIYEGEEYELSDEEMEALESATERIKRGKETDWMSIDISELTDIRTVDIDTEKPLLFRIIDYVNQVKNPYCFRVGDVKVRMSFADTDRTLTDNFIDMFFREHPEFRRHDPNKPGGTSGR